MGVPALGHPEEGHDFITARLSPAADRGRQAMYFAPGGGVITERRVEHDLMCVEGAEFVLEEGELLFAGYGAELVVNDELRWLGPDGAASHGPAGDVVTEVLDAGWASWVWRNGSGRVRESRTQ